MIAERRLIHLDRVDDHLRCQERIGDDLGLGKRVILDVLIIIGMQSRIVRRFDLGIQICLRKRRPRETPARSDEFNHDLGGGLGHIHTRQDRALNQGARAFFAQISFEFRLAHPGLIQSKAIGFAIKGAVDPLKGRDPQNVLLEVFVPNRDPEI